jgi:hypothetical protein
VPVGSPPWITSIDVSRRWKYCPSKYPARARKTNELTVSGARFGSSSITIVPHEVAIVAV